MELLLSVLAVDVAASNGLPGGCGDSLKGDAKARSQLSYRAPYWLTFTDRGSICIEAENCELAIKRGSRLGNVQTCDVLPYPASPRALPQSSVPSFCWRPDECKGRSSCPHNPSCTN